MRKTPPPPPRPDSKKMATKKRKRRKREFQVPRSLIPCVFVYFAFSAAKLLLASGFFPFPLIRVYLFDNARRESAIT
jgi:hypothetical protein